MDGHGLVSCLMSECKWWNLHIIMNIQQLQLFVFIIFAYLSSSHVRWCVLSLINEYCIILYLHVTRLCARLRQLFDAVIVVTSFSLDLVFIQGITGPQSEEAIALLIIFLLWRILRIINGTNGNYCQSVSWTEDCDTNTENSATNSSCMHTIHSC